MNVSPAGYYWMTKLVLNAATAVGSPLCMLLEGGYFIDSLAYGVQFCIEVKNSRIFSHGLKLKLLIIILLSNDSCLTVSDMLLRCIGKWSIIRIFLQFRKVNINEAGMSPRNIFERKDFIICQDVFLLTLISFIILFQALLGDPEPDIQLGLCNHIFLHSLHNAILFHGHEFPRLQLLADITRHVRIRCSIPEITVHFLHQFMIWFSHNISFDVMYSSHKASVELKRSAYHVHWRTCLTSEHTILAR